MEVRAGHPDINLEKMLKFIEDAKREEADLIIFPHQSIAGSLAGNLLLQPTFMKDCIAFREDILKSSEGMTTLLSNTKTSGALDVKVRDKRYSIAYTFEDKPCSADFGFIETKADLCVVFTATPFVIGKNRTRDAYFKERAKVWGCPIIHINCIGVQNAGKTIYPFDGNSTVYNSKGEVVLRAKSFEESLIFLDLDKIDVMSPIIETKEPEIAEVYRALHGGVKHFLSQIGMKKIVIGISGGIDSAVDAALYTKVLGAENVLLVNMPSVFNSTTTRGLSEQLAKNLGCNYMVVPIQESVDHTVNQLESIPMTYLADGSTHNIELSSFVRENIQARDRSSRILAALAAAFGGGFTCNANKAETTIGYATMYGDCAGVVSALADLWKHQVYALAHYLNDEVYKHEVIPQGIIDIVPSAELSTAQNVDEGKGDPLKYPYHDYLFKAFVEDNKTPEEILQWYSEGILEEQIGCGPGLVKKYFTYAEEFINDLERWWNMFTGIAVAKRIQAPPLIAVTEHAFGSDFPEAQSCTYYSRAYKSLKSKLMKE
ncbi:MAG: NAD(+) synthase [Selenomonadaceae bacterium]|nr:NAD(+) synthase [Selenomonadaceae bacterium]